MSFHEDSGCSCCVAHWGEKDGKRIMLEGCISCATCGEYIRPEKMNEECPGYTEPIDKGWKYSEITRSKDVKIGNKIYREINDEN